MDKDYLVGKCLVAMPNLDDTLFSHSVVYVCSHGEDGAMGFIVNKQIKEFYFSDLMNQLNMPYSSNLDGIVLHQGGPIDQIRGFVLHSRDYDCRGTLPINADFAISSSVEVLHDVAFGIGPAYNLVALGYSSWVSKQLEGEIINNDWLVTEASIDLLFKTPDNDKWQKAVDELGFDIKDLSLRTGRA
ncbi:MAG: YqgE/AlgH family protein [Alphaproteobacteria bacterium]|nr:YqgE/AlgH family protein [Alphaproteobacteria bacterium]